MSKEKISKPPGFVLTRNNMLMQHMKEISNKPIPPGITQYLSNYSVWHLFSSFEREINAPRRIPSMSDLEFGFASWLIASFVSFWFGFVDAALFGKGEG